MKQKKYEEFLIRTLPECEEVECKKCERNIEKNQENVHVFFKKKSPCG